MLYFICHSWLEKVTDIDVISYATDGLKKVTDVDVMLYVTD